MMLQPLSQKSAKKAVSDIQAIPAPTLGWISQQNITMGKPGTALILDNFFPYPESVDLRGGFDEHCDTTETTAVNTLMPYHAQSGSNKLFAVSNDTIYDVTTSTASATTVTTLTSSKMQYVNFVNSGSTYLWACNGADSPVHYSGSAWATPSITGLTSPSAADIINVNVYKSRLYVCFKNSLKFGYLATGAIAGACSTYELGAEFSKGGYLMAMATWTRDGGSGTDDRAVFITSEGQVAVYDGSDPSDSNNWSKVGIYNLPRPIGRRCTIEVSGDVYIVTESGIIPLSKSFLTDSASAGAIALTYDIQSAMNRAAKSYATSFGWQLMAYPKGTMAILNVPITEGSQSHQYVMNTTSGAWCRFTGQNAACWSLMGSRLFFGGYDGKVYEADVNGTDNGDDIVGDMKLYFDYCKSKAAVKDWKAVQPTIYSDGQVTPSVGLNVDYADDIPAGALVASSGGTLLLGSFNLGAEVLPPDRIISNNWVAVNAKPGRAAAVRMRVAAQGGTLPVFLQVVNFNLLFEKGSISG